jgi:periplasmic divalent cation tolerance protein
MAEDALLILSTFGTLEEARRVGRTIVEEHLAACANLVPSVESIYHWKGNVETSSETMVLFKTTTDRYWQLETRIREMHSYETPEIIAVRLHAGLPAYLRWIDESCLPPAK